MSNEGDAEPGAAPFRYDAPIDLSNKNNSQTLAILLTGRGKSVLDVGTATGYVAGALVKRDCRVTGIEIDANAAAIAGAYCERMIVGDIETMDLDDLLAGQQFDVIIFGDVLEHLSDPRAVLAKVGKLLAPGGCVVASIPNITHGSIRLSLLAGRFEYRDLGLLDRTHLRFFDKAGVTELFQGSGYEIVSWRYVRLDPLGTEIALDPGDFPEHLVAALRADDQALVYQYIVKASLSSNNTSPMPRPGRNGKNQPQRSANKILQKLLEDDRRRFRSETSAATQRVKKSERAVVALQARVDEQTAHIHALEQQVRNITGSVSYRLLMPIRATIDGVDRLTSGRRKVLRAGRVMRAGLRREGPAWFARRATRPRSWPDLLRRLSDSPPSGVLTLNDQYEEWLRKHSPTELQLEGIRKTAQRLSYRPLISIVTPVYNPEISWLRDAIESVLAQAYDNWELCLADDCSTRPGVRDLLTEYAARDARIKVTLLNENGGISAASNAALSLVTGEFIGLLDHDDEIAPDALFEIANLLNEQPDLDYIYTDEDKKDPDGKRIDPFFKPDWSPDLLLCVNYVTHFSVYRAALVRELGGFTHGLEGSQDYDLVLRVTEKTDRIAHVARQLYSWRMTPGSAASSLTAKNYAHTAARKAIENHLARCGVRAVVEDGFHKGDHRVRYEIDGAPKVAIIIPTRDKVHLLRRCIDSVRRKSTYQNYEIIIIDNQSKEPETLEYLRGFDGRVIAYPHEFNYSEQMNLGVREAGCEYVIFLNNDTEVLTPGWIEAMLEHAQRPQVGAVGCRLLYADGRPQHEGVFMGVNDGVAGNLNHGGYFSLGERLRDVTAVTGACLMTKAPLYQEVGGLDPALRVAYNDVDYCLKLLQKGYRIVYTPYAQLLHEESASRGALHPQENEDIFRARWRSYREPYVNPNFDADRPFTRLRS